MAAQPQVKQAPAAVPPPRKGGRPPGSKNRTEAQKRFDYSKHDVRFQKMADFHAFLQGYPDKTGLMAYFFRVRPKIDHGLIGINQVSIHESVNPDEMTETFIGNTFGRGVYQLRLDDANRRRGERSVARIVVEIEDHEKPPVYDIRTLCLAEPKNQDEIQRHINLGNLVRDPVTQAARLRQPGDGPAPSTVPTSAPGQVASPVVPNDVLGSAFIKILDRGLQDSSTKIEDVIKVAALMHPKQEVSVDAIADRVLAKINPAPQAQGNDFDAYERVEKFIGRIRGVAGPAVEVLTDAAPAGHANFSNPASWLPHVGPAIRELRLFIGDLGGLLRRPGPQGAAPPPQQNGVVEMPLDRSKWTIEQRVGELAELALAKMDEGVEGFDFAAWACAFHPGGREVFDYLVEVGGAVAVMGMLGMNPITRPMTKDPARRQQLESFLFSLFSFDPSVDPDEFETESGGETVPAAR